MAMASFVFQRQSGRLSILRSRDLHLSSISRQISASSQPRRRGKWPFATASAVALAVAAYSLGAIYPPAPVSMIFPRIASAPPPNSDSPESIEYTRQLEETLQSLPLLKTFRSQPDANEWYEARPYKQFPEERRVNNLIAGALRGPGKLAIPGLVRARKNESESVAFIHLGRGLCGHDGIVHGGLLSTLLDEILARTAIHNLPEKVGVTANLALNYRAPTRADQFVLVKTKLVTVNGRKAVVSGTVEDLKGTLLVEATATFVQPRYAKLLNPTLIKHAMGERDHSLEPVLLADGENLNIK